MSGTDTSSLRAQIVDAWRDAVYPGDERICEPTYDDEGVSVYFRGRGWQQHAVTSLRYHSVALSFFTAEAFAYYLPAYMLAVIDDAAGADVIHDGILFHLSPRQLDKQWADSYLARVACLSPSQRAAAIAYLEWCVAGNEYLRVEVEETIEYLSSGERPVRGSALERLLELAGESHRDPAWIDRLMLGYTTVGDTELAALPDLPALRVLELADTSLTDTGLALVARASGVTALDLSSCKLPTAAGLAHLARLPGLAELKLPNAGITDTKLTALAPLQLRTLDLTHAQVTDAGWAALDVSRLEQLDMFGVVATDALLSRVGDAARLRKLTAKSLTDAGAQALARAPLQELQIDAAQLSEVGISELAKIATLRKLELSRVVVDRWPPGWLALEELSLLEIELSAASAAGIGKLARLRDLSVWAIDVEPGALAASARAPNLAQMTIWRSRTPLDLGELATAPALQTLSVHDATVTGVAALAGLAPLTTLTLSNVTPADDLPAALATVGMRELELMEIALDESQLALLAACPRLQSLRVTASKVPTAALARLRKARPAIVVIET